APVPPWLDHGYMYGSRQQISFDRGDRLLIRLLNAADGVRFERDLLALTEKLWEGRHQKEGDWVLGVPQVLDDETNRGRRLKMMTTLETTKGRSPGRDGVLQQTTPRSVWWDVAPGGPAGAKAGTLRVKPLYGYPAPA